MMNRLDYHTVLLAGLLHDVGKLLQRGDFGGQVRGQHPEISASFVEAFRAQFDRCCDASLLKTLVQHHHESASFPTELRVQSIDDPRVRALAYLVSRADNLSSSERGEHGEGWRDFRATRLALVFGQLAREVAAESGTPLAPESLYLPARPLTDVGGLDCIFGEAEAQHRPGDVNGLIRGFGDEFARLAKSLDWDSYECVFSHLLALLQRYAWALPSDTQELVPDVSLYDHLKTTAAIAGCLYQYHAAKGTLDSGSITASREPRFRLLVGDVSGIQGYIFGIANAGAGGVAKRLRARSLYVQLLSEVASHRVLQAIDLPPANVVMASGGKFYVLLPNTDAASDVCRQMQHDADSWFLRATSGELALNLASVEFGDEGFRPGAERRMGFGGVLERLAGELGARKRRRYAEVLQTDGGWAQERFLLAQDFAGEGPCTSCGKFPRHQGGLCTRCERDTALGAMLPRARYLCFYADGSGDADLLGHSVIAVENAHEIAGRPYLVVRLNDARLGEVARHPAAFRFIANHVPSDPDGATTTFAEIAARSDGRQVLGYLKADVDRLGETFIFGLKREPPEASRDTISRLATLSRELDLFFSGWVEHLTNTDEFSDCYTVFSGGDDLLIVGPWDRSLTLARRLNADFGRFTGHPGLTLSAGIVVTSDRLPVSRATEHAERGVESAKQRGRARLSLLGHTLRWVDVAPVLAHAQELAADTPSSALLYALRRYGEMWRRYRDDGDVLSLRFQPLLAYNVARNVDPFRQPRLDRWVRDLVGLRPADAGQRLVLDNLALIAGVCILRRRG